MVRRIAITAAFSLASLLAFASPASAASYGSVTLSFGSGGSYYDDNYDYPYYGYSYPEYNNGYWYEDEYYAPEYRSYYDNGWGDEYDEDQ